MAIFQTQPMRPLTSASQRRQALKWPIETTRPGPLWQIASGRKRSASNQKSNGHALLARLFSPLPRKVDVSERRRQVVTKLPSLQASNLKAI
ncbi:hypothetical protein D917_07690 [Trichinella nativa]|uniref:Uncharacterized protein n=1 Tax=Trichinella nativa TaxID=6335 RepID=A0A1Y3EMW9_9BILA|nr:hypothetical protein D917_07690 [Trichinella nativa]